MAVNGAIVVGYKLAGAAGVLISILGTVIPPFVILSLISVCYQAFRENWLVSHMLEGMQAGVGAVIASVTYEMGAGVLKMKKISFQYGSWQALFLLLFFWKSMWCGLCLSVPESEFSEPIAGRRKKA